MIFSEQQQRHSKTMNLNLNVDVYMVQNTIGIGLYCVVGCELDRIDSIRVEIVFRDIIGCKISNVGYFVDLYKCKILNDHSLNHIEKKYFSTHIHYAYHQQTIKLEYYYQKKYYLIMIPYISQSYKIYINYINIPLSIIKLNPINPITIRIDFYNTIWYILDAIDRITVASVAYATFNGMTSVIKILIKPSILTSFSDVLAMIFHENKSNLDKLGNFGCDYNNNSNTTITIKWCSNCSWIFCSCYLFYSLCSGWVITK